MSIKSIIFPLVTMSEPIETFDAEGNIVQEGGSRIGNIIGWVVHAVLMILAGWLEWSCNSTSPVLVKILNTFVAVIFSYIYLIYYFIVHIFMSKPCDGTQPALINKLTTAVADAKRTTTAVIIGQSAPAPNIAVPINLSMKTAPVPAPFIAPAPAPVPAPVAPAPVPVAPVPASGVATTAF